VLSTAQRHVRASVVIVNWNAGDMLRACVQSLMDDARRGCPVVVVDNGSSDGSTTAAAAACPWMTVVAAGRNLGFAGGANLGAAQAPGDAVVFLNPDARVLPGAVAELVAALTEPGVGVAGGGLLDEDGRWQPGAARFGPIGHLLLDTTLGRLPARWRRRPYRVDWVYGTFMAVRADLFRQLGGFDPDYFLYGEDMDLCHRARQLGARTVHVPRARAVHGANVSAGKRFGIGREAEVVKGELRFYRRRGRGLQLEIFRGLGAGKFGAKAALAGLLGRRRTAATYWRVVRACLEPSA
jgi:N-acetylglucosaminyl-diphospho-decaprenol L-rhamnosyltransferase